MQVKICCMWEEKKKEKQVEKSREKEMKEGSLHVFMSLPAWRRCKWEARSQWGRKEAPQVSMWVSQILASRQRWEVPVGASPGQLGVQIMEYIISLYTSKSRT